MSGYDECVVVAVGHIRIYSHTAESHDGERKGRWESLGAKGQKVTYTPRQSEAVYKYVIGFWRLFSRGMGGSSSGPFSSQSDARQRMPTVGPSINTNAAASEVADKTTAINRETIATITLIAPEDMNVSIRE